MEFKEGDILNFAYPNWLFQIGNLIHFGKRGYTHSAIVGFVDKKGVYVYEALDEGIVGSYYEQWWLDARLKNKVLNIGKADVKGINNLCKKHVGDKYSFMSILDIAIYWLTGRTNVRSTEDEWICSEFVAEMLRQSNPKINIDKELKLPSNDYVSPMDLYSSKLIRWEYEI